MSIHMFIHMCIHMSMHMSRRVPVVLREQWQVLGQYMLRIDAACAVTDEQDRTNQPLSDLCNNRTCMYTAARG